MVASAASPEQAALEAREKEEHESRRDDDCCSSVLSSTASRYGFSGGAESEAGLLEKVGLVLTLVFGMALAFILVAMALAPMWLPTILFGYRNDAAAFWKALGRLGMTSYDGATMSAIIVSAIGGLVLYALVRGLMDS